MATLEIHEVGQRVRRVRVGRGHPVMVGTNPIADVPLTDPSVQSFHARVRWSQTRFKVETVGEVPFVEVNGRRVKSGSFRQGDELKVGHTRIFLLSDEDDGPDHGEKTVIQAPPPAGLDLEADFAPIDLDEPAPPPRATPSRTQAPSTPPPPAYHQMEMAPPSLEFPLDESDPEADFIQTPPPAPRPSQARPQPRPTPTPVPPPLPRGAKHRQNQARRSRRSILEDDDLGLDDSEDEAEAGEPLRGGRSAVADLATSTTQEQAPARPTLRQRVVSLVRGADRAPGDERVFTSPVVIGLALTFVVLVGLSVSLYRWIVRTDAQNRLAAATEAAGRGDYPAALKGFDAYLAVLPDGDKANRARVGRAQARVRQHLGVGSGSWTNAYKEAVALLDEVGSLPEYRDISVDLTDDLRKIADGMLERAEGGADADWLRQADAAIALHGKVAGTQAEALLARSPIPARRIKAVLAIRKGADLKATLAAIDAALGAKQPGAAYQARARLLRNYPELATFKEIVVRLARTNDLVRDAARLDPAGRPGVAEPGPEPLGPPTSLVVRLDPDRPAEPTGRVALALVDGLVFALDGATGAPLWQAPAGLACPFPPVLVEGAGGGTTGSALFVDARSRELVCREARTGRFRWRQALDGWAADPPLVLGSRILQPLVDGRLLEIDLRSGDLRGTLRLGRAITRSPVATESAERAYLLGAEDCLFVLDLDPLRCAAVEFLGHEAGTIACSVARAGRLIILPENHLLDSGRWRIFLADAAGVNLRLVQEIAIGGWTWGAPATAGTIVWSTSDRGEVVAHTVGALDKPNPLATIARLAPGPERIGPAFPLARTEREFYVASGASAHYELGIDRGTITPVWTQGSAGHALAPPQVVGPLTVLTQQADPGPGTALWGIESRTGTVRWRTVLGASWPTRWVVSPGGDGLTSLTSDGRDLALHLDQLRAGGFVEQPLPRPGGPPIVAQAGFRRLDPEGLTILIPPGEPTSVLIRESAGEFRPVPLPAPLVTDPLPLGRNLLLPGPRGRIDLIEPRTGLSAADPYVPPFNRDKTIRWLAPTGAEGDSAAVILDTGGTLRRLAVEGGDRPRLVVVAERTLDSPPVAAPCSTGAACLVATKDGKLRAFSTRDLRPIGTIPLGGPPRLGPIATEGFGFVVDATGQVTATDTEGQRLWSAPLREPRVIGPPVVRGDLVWFAGRDRGTAEGFRLADGTPGGIVRLDAEPTAPLMALDADLVVATGLGTLQLLNPDKQPEPRTNPSPPAGGTPR